MKKFLIYKCYDEQSEQDIFRCLIGDKDKYQERKESLDNTDTIYNDNGEVLVEDDSEYEEFYKTIQKQLKLKCGKAKP